MMKKSFAVLIALCLVFALGGCTVSFGDVGIGGPRLRTVRGSGDMVEQVFPLDKSEDYFNLHIADFNFNVRGITTAYIIVDETAEHAVTIVTDDNIAELISIEFQEGRNRIVVEADRNIRFSPTELTITVGLPLNQFDVFGGAWNVRYHCTRASYLLPRFSGAVNAEFYVGELNNLGLQMDGAGTIHLQGTTETATLVVNGAGNIHAFDLTAETVEVILNGAGNAEITAMERLDAEINGLGSITYDGNPTVNRRVAGLGRVRSRNQD